MLLGIYDDIARQLQADLLREEEQAQKRVIMLPKVYVNLAQGIQSLPFKDRELLQMVDMVKTASTTKPVIK